MLREGGASSKPCVSDSYLALKHLTTTDYRIIRFADDDID
jgi:hypothetical protein